MDKRQQRYLHLHGGRHARRETDHAAAILTAAPPHAQGDNHPAATSHAAAAWRLRASVVVHEPDTALLRSTLDSLWRALDVAAASGQLGMAEVVLVDNSISQRDWQAWLRAEERPRVRVLAGHGNIGYGRGHNLALADWQGECVLVLNPDVAMDPAALATGLGYLQAHPEVTLATPSATDVAGATLDLCKRYPSLWGLLLRGIAPAHAEHANRRYEWRELRSAPAPVQARFLASGCFMLIPTAAWRSVQGFDPGYFLYFEDFDISLRLAHIGPHAYLPAMRIVHAGGHAARKNLRHVSWFVRSALRFFHTHGWSLWPTPAAAP